MGQIVVDADYRVVPERTLDVIATEIRIIDAQLCQAIVQGAVEIGRRLKEAKEKIDHGQWENWCESNLNYTASWASKLMRISEEYGDKNSAYAKALAKTDTCPDLSISKALRLLRVPEEAVETFVETHNLTEMTVKELEEEIRKLKEEKSDLEEKEAGYQEDMERLEAEKRTLKEQLTELEHTSPTTGLEEELQKKEDLLLEAQRQLQEAGDKIKSLKEKVKAEKQKAADEISAAVKVATAEARQKAEEEQRQAMEEALAKADEALRRAEEAEEKLITATEDAKAEARAMATLNIKGELMQEAFNGIVESIFVIGDLEKREKLRAGVVQILDRMRGRI